ncbi:MAG: hypothetical protein KVP17_003077 [Porospora cf. gigantea B]|uniref:uncharacterized protein n=1 Tax=Porospora cf. gigantea B TaxID=2853592 RepID=UPI0035718A50|nr:MAG: hypothetical protein KVP17_003077 [Porospora cf. gigantea B]
MQTRGNDQPTERPKPAGLTGNLDRYLGQKVMVKLVGGREVCGILKGHDKISNLVLDHTEETLNESRTRKLGLTLTRGTSVMMIAPVDGYEAIENPFVTE